MSAKSPSIEITRPVVTRPSKPVLRLSDSSSSAAKLSLSAAAVWVSVMMLETPFVVVRSSAPRECGTADAGSGSAERGLSAIGSPVLTISSALASA
jgi:hypothetical protein